MDSFSIYHQVSVTEIGYAHQQQKEVLLPVREPAKLGQQYKPFRVIESRLCTEGGPYAVYLKLQTVEGHVYEEVYDVYGDYRTQWFTRVSPD